MTVKHRRTEYQRAADRIDCDLYSVIGSVEKLYDAMKPRNNRTAEELCKALMALHSARTPIRMLMHNDDRERTR